MEQQNSVSNDQRDQELWEIAKRRARFKQHLGTYVVVISFLWVIWYFSGSEQYGSRYAWPVWPMAGWGLGLFFHYLGAYYPKINGVEKEYEKLLREKNKS